MTSVPLPNDHDNAASSTTVYRRTLSQALGSHGRRDAFKPFGEAMTSFPPTLHEEINHYDGRSSRYHPFAPSIREGSGKDTFGNVDFHDTNNWHKSSTAPDYTPSTELSALPSSNTTSPAQHCISLEGRKAFGALSSHSFGLNPFPSHYQPPVQGYHISSSTSSQTHYPSISPATSTHALPPSDMRSTSGSWATSAHDWPSPRLSHHQPYHVNGESIVNHGLNHPSSQGHSLPHAKVGGGIASSELPMAFMGAATSSGAGCSISTSGGHVGLPQQKGEAGRSSAPLGVSTKRKKTRDGRTASNVKREGDDSESDDRDIEGEDRKVKQRATKACDKCRDQKCKCVPDPDNPGRCTQCSLIGMPCTFHGPSLKRGPPKGYLAAVITRLEAMEDTILAKLSGEKEDPRARQLLLELIGESALAQVLSGRLEFSKRKGQGAKKGAGPHGTTWHENWWVQCQGIPIHGHQPPNSRSLGTRFLELKQSRDGEPRDGQGQPQDQLSNEASGSGDVMSSTAAEGFQSYDSAMDVYSREVSSKTPASNLLDSGQYTTAGSIPTHSPDWPQQSLRPTMTAMSTNFFDATSGEEKLHHFQPAGRPAPSLPPPESEECCSGCRRFSCIDGTGDLSPVVLVGTDQIAVREPDHGVAFGSGGERALSLYRENPDVLLHSAITGFYKISDSHSSFFHGIWHLPPACPDAQENESDSMNGGTPMSTDREYAIDKYFENVQPQLPIISERFYKTLKQKRSSETSTSSLKGLEYAMCEASNSLTVNTYMSADSPLSGIRRGSTVDTELRVLHGRASLNKVIALLITGYDLLTKGQELHCCTVVSAAVTNAMAIGLHRPDSNLTHTSLFDAEDCQARRMAWSSCLFLDKILLLMGYCSSINLRLCDAPPPTIQDFDGGGHRNYQTLAGAPDDESCEKSESYFSTRLLDFFHQYAIVADELVNVLFAVQKPTQGKITKLEREILHLNDVMSEHGFCGRSSDQQRSYNLNLMHHENIRIGAQLLHHQMLIQFHSRLQGSTAAVESAIAISNLLEGCSGSLQLPAWAINAVFVAGTEIAAEIVRSTLFDQRKTLCESMARIKKTLKDHSSRIPLAACRLELLQGVQLSAWGSRNDSDRSHLASSFGLINAGGGGGGGGRQSHDGTPHFNESTRMICDSRSSPHHSNFDVDHRMSLGMSNGGVYSRAPDPNGSHWKGGGSYLGAHPHDYVEVGQGIDEGALSFEDKDDGEVPSRDHMRGHSFASSVSNHRGSRGGEAPSSDAASWSHLPSGLDGDQGAYNSDSNTSPLDTFANVATAPGVYHQSVSLAASRSSKAIAANHSGPPLGSISLPSPGNDHRAPPYSTPFPPFNNGVGDFHASHTQGTTWNTPSFRSDNCHSPRESSGGGSSMGLGLGLNLNIGSTTSSSSPSGGTAGGLDHPHHPSHGMILNGTSCTSIGNGTSTSTSANSASAKILTPTPTPCSSGTGTSRRIHTPPQPSSAASKFLSTCRHPPLLYIPQNAQHPQQQQQQQQQQQTQQGQAQQQHSIEEESSSTLRQALDFKTKIDMGMTSNDTTTTTTVGSSSSSNASGVGSGVGVGGGGGSLLAVVGSGAGGGNSPPPSTSTSSSKAVVVSASASTTMMISKGPSASTSSTGAIGATSAGGGGSKTSHS